MKKSAIFLLAILLGISCSKQKIPQKTAAELNSVPARAERMEDGSREKPIVEMEEKFMAVDEEPPAESLYFVIIGSFRNKDNALKHQEEIRTKGFTSILLRNEAGLFRVSVKATDDISGARNEIQRIRKNFPEYGDTWLLIRKK